MSLFKPLAGCKCVITHRNTYDPKLIVIGGQNDNDENVDTHITYDLSQIIGNDKLRQLMHGVFDNKNKKKEEILPIHNIINPYVMILGIDKYGSNDIENNETNQNQSESEKSEKQKQEKEDTNDNDESDEEHSNKTKENKKENNKSENKENILKDNKNENKEWKDLPGVKINTVKLQNIFKTFGTDKFKILVMHHHLLPIPIGGLEENIIPFKDYSPPFIVKDIQTLDEIFLI